MIKQRKVAIAVERSSAYGRNFICGVADAVEQHPEWALTLIDPHQIAACAMDGYDGWICRIADAYTSNVLAKCERPVVDCLCEKPNCRFASVQTDANAIGRLAADHLLSHRFTSFAFCGYRNVAFSDRRRNAFVSYLKTKGFHSAIYRPPHRPANHFGRDFLLGDRVELPPDIVDLTSWLKRLEKPVGVFCCDDLRASQVMAICRNLKLNVPTDVAILGVDDDPVYCMFATPRLSSIDPDAIEIGRIAAKTLAALFNDETLLSNPPTRKVAPKGIVKRASTNTYPAAPAWLAKALDFIQSNIGCGISASDVFRHVGFSRTLVERVFKECLGTTIQSEIARVRMEEACRLLSSTSLSIKEIAGLSGFSSLEYFSRAFSAAQGLPPSSWREKN